MTLRRQAFSGVRWTSFSSLGRAALQFAQIAVLARVLAPADFGLMALVVAIMAFLQVFADAGVSNAIIHHQDISQDQLSSLYWLNVMASSVLALLLVFASGWVAAWYQQPDLQYLLWFAGLALLVAATAQQLRIVAQKNLRFSSLAKIELLSAVTGFGVALTVAFSGGGVYSLVLGSLTSALAGCCLAWWWLAEGWRPKLRLHLAEIKQFLKFGAYMIGNNLANTFNSQVDILLGGKLLGAQAIGLYSVPKDLNLRIAGVINPIVTQVGMPVMAKAQDDKALLKRVYLQTMRMTSSVNFPIYVALGVFAPEIVHVLLGPKWEESIPLLQVFAIWGLLRSTGNPVGSLLMARGRADLSFKWNIAWLFVMPPVIWFGSQYGVMGMAVAMTALGIIGYWPNWYFMVRPLCGAGLNEYSVQVIVPLIISLMANLLGYISAMPLEGNLIRLIVGLLVGGLTHLLFCWYFNREWVMAIIELSGKRVYVNQ